MAIRITAFGLSDQGKVRSKNEDTMAVESPQGIVMVADGMGGAPAGEVASALAVQEVCRGFHSGQGVKDSILRANKKILEMSYSQPAFKGMGTTLTAFRVKADSGEFEIGHVGDSRAYRLHQGSLWRLTADHSVAEAMVAEGALTPQQGRNHPMSHILSRAVGTHEEVEVDLILGVAEPGDRFLLCSDGLIRVFEDQELEERLVGWDGRKLELLVQGMVNEANLRGGPDNITVAVLAVDPTD
jgi:serine/threonine protein phosphatase PrpC